MYAPLLPSSHCFLTTWYRIHSPISHLLIGYTFSYISLSDLSKIILLVTKLDTRFLILVLAIMDLGDQQLSIALDQFWKNYGWRKWFIFVAIGKALRPR